MSRCALQFVQGVAGRRRDKKVALGKKVEVEGLRKAAVTVIVVAGAARCITDVKAAVERDSLYAGVEVLRNVRPQRPARLAVLIFSQCAEDLERKIVGRGLGGPKLHMPTAEIMLRLGGVREPAWEGQPSAQSPPSAPSFLQLPF